MKIKSAGQVLTIGLLLLGVLIGTLVSMSLSRTNAIKNIWAEFEIGRSERLNAIISLRSELGYGGMIHNYKNYILRQRDSDADATVSSLGAARASLESYKSLGLTATEERAVLELEQVIDAYNDALMLISTNIELGKPISQIDGEIEIDDVLALRALITLEDETFFIDQEHIEENSRALLLSGLRKAMGYGGLIHNFKNYILHYSDEARIQVNTEIKDIVMLIDIYQTYDITPIERSALRKILTVAQTYQKRLTVIQSMVTQGYTPQEVDAAVIFDDTPALDGFSDLQRQLVIRNGVNSRQLKQNVETVYIFGQIILYVTILSFAVFVVLTTWLLKYQIISPLAGLNLVMSRLSKNDLEVEIQNTDSDTEVGEMTRSVEVFKRNAVEKQAGELALKDANEELEAKVEERTKELRSNERKLTSLVETAADAIITIDEQGFILTFNAAAIVMFGYTSNEIVGRNINVLMPDTYTKHYEDFQENYAKISNKKAVWNGREAEALRKNGDSFPVEFSISEIKGETGGKILTNIIRDVTEKKAKDLELELSIEKTKRASKAKSEFLSRVTHELRTPMNAVIGFSDLLATDTENKLTAEQLESVLYIRENGERLLELIEGVLDLSEIETGYAEVFVEPISVNNLIIQVINVLEVQTNRDAVEFTNKISGEAPIEINADYQRLKQVLLSLASNAGKHGGEKSQVKFSCDKTGRGSFRVNVSDDGECVPDEVLPKMFEPFNWIDKNSTGISGVGVGLTICKELVELMGGEIGVLNNPGGGLTFWVEFEEV